MRFYSYCPKCGYIVHFQGECPHCNVDLIETDELYDFDRDIGEAKKQIIERIYEEYKVKENPQFSQKRYELRLQEEEELRKKAYEPSTHQFSFNKIKCPNCSSTNVQRLSTATKVVSTGLFGLGSKTVGKTYKCNGCGYYW